MLTILLLGACTEPAILDAVADELAERAVESGQAPIQRFVFLAGIAAEAAGMNSEERLAPDFHSVVAESFRLGTPEVTDASGKLMYTFDDVGPSGESGELVLTIENEGSSFNLIYTYDVLVFTSSFTLAWQDTSEVILTGTGTDNGAATTLTAMGVVPYAGLGWSPPDSGLPSSGWARWSDEAAARSITLLPAEDYDLSTGIWPAQAQGTQWLRNVEIDVLGLTQME